MSSEIDLTPERDALIQSLCDELARRYVLPEVATTMIGALRESHAAGTYAALDGPALVDRLTEQLQAISGDKHLRVYWSATPLPPAAPDGAEAEARARYREQARLRNYGFARVERLDGNIGYLDLRAFDAAFLGGATAVAAMTLLASTDALIVDLRKNGGGWPQMVALLSSYLFDPEGMPVHLNSMYWREEDITQQSWALPYVPGPYFGAAKPVYVLTSDDTFSGAEEFSYNLQSLGRATIIGATTRGGANPGTRYRISEHCSAFIPVGRAINPIRGDNWEGRGVIPDIAVPAAEAFDVAWRLALEHVLAAPGAAEPGPRAELAAEARAAMAALPAGAGLRKDPAPSA